MTAAVQFVPVADHVLVLEENLTERLTELVDSLDGLGHRLQLLEQTLSATTGENPLATTILARLDAFEAKLAALELRQRRPTPLTVVQNHRLDEANGRCSSNCNGCSTRWIVRSSRTKGTPPVAPPTMPANFA